MIEKGNFPSTHSHCSVGMQLGMGHLLLGQVGKTEGG